MSSAQIAVVIPHFQRKPGLLGVALRSVFTQSLAAQVHVVVVDDESPVSAESEVAALNDVPKNQLTIIRQKNGGAGSARNKALDNVPAGVQFVAFLDSDDSWRPGHLENAVAALNQGFDGYFADWWSYNFPEQTNFERIQALQAQDHVAVAGAKRAYALGVTPLEHIIKDGGGVIQTSTVVYRFHQYPQLRFREQFYNGQDFFFWMDLGQLGAKFVFSFEVDCDNGEGINIYQGAGWGTERSLQRLRNELFVWTSARKFYPMSPTLLDANKRTIRNLQQGVVRDLLHRLRHRRPISGKLLGDIIKMDPFILALMPWVPMKVVLDKLFRRGS